MLIDLHVHSDISPCSRLGIGRMLELAPLRGLGGLCITDHGTMEARRLVREGVQPGGLVVLVGMEYATPQGDFLIFGPFRELAPGMEAGELLALVDMRGGAAVAAHPCRGTRPLDADALRRWPCHGVEVLNGRNSLRENEAASAYPGTFGLASTAGSDAHAEDELGRFATRFQGPVRCVDDLVRALRAGLCAPESIHPERYPSAARVISRPAVRPA